MADLTDIDVVKSLLDKQSTKDDGLLRLIVAGVSKRAERYMGRTIGRHEKTDYHRPSASRHELVLTEGPVVEVKSVTEGATTLVAADYRIEDDRTLVRLSGTTAIHWAAGVEVTTVYDAGFESVPADLEMAAAMQSAFEYRQTKPGNFHLGLKSVSPSAGGETLQLAEHDWLPGVKATLTAYRPF